MERSLKPMLFCLVDRSLRSFNLVWFKLNDLPPASTLGPFSIRFRIVDSTDSFVVINLTVWALRASSEYCSHARHYISVTLPMLRPTVILNEAWSLMVEQLEFKLYSFLAHLISSKRQWPSPAQRPIKGRPGPVNRVPPLYSSLHISCMEFWVRNRLVYIED